MATSCSKKSGSEITVSDSYIKAIQNELLYRIKKNRYASSHEKSIEEIMPSWNTIYIGGGTPSLLTSFKLHEILNFAKQSNKEATEITI